MDQKAFNKRWNEVGRSLGLVEPVREGVLTELGQGAALGAVSGLRGFASTLEELGGPAGPRKYFDAVLATNQQWNPDPDYTALSLNPANIARTVGTGAGQTATLLPAIAAGTAVGGPGGAALVGTAVFAQTYGDNLKDYRERFKDRYSENEIRAMSFGRTLVDSAIETGLGSVPLAGKSIRTLINGRAADAVARNAIKEASKKFGKATVVKALNNGFTRAVGKGALGEGGEEALQYIQDVIWRSVAGDPSAVLNWGELAENAAAGAWAGAAFGAVDAGTGRMAQRDRRAAMPPIDVAEAVSPAWMKHYGVKDDSGAELAGLVASAPEGMSPADFTIVQPKSRAAKAVDAIGRELGLDIRYFVPMSENGAALNGVFARDSDAIYLDAAGTSRNPMQSLGHEFAHYLGKQAPDLADVWDQALNSAANPEARAAEETALRETYGELGEAGAEFSADRMGDMFTDPGMWSRAVQLAEAKQAGFGAKLLKVIDRFISAVKRQLVKFKSSEVEKFITDMDAAREAAAGVVAEFKRRQAGMLVPVEEHGQVRTGADEHGSAADGHALPEESTEAGTLPPFEASRELWRRQAEDVGRMAGMLEPTEEHGLARTGTEGTDEHGSGADGHRPPKEGTDGADNIYLRMPLERVRQDAAHGVKLAQEALKELEAQETAAEPEPAAEEHGLAQTSTDREGRNASVPAVKVRETSVPEPAPEIARLAGVGSTAEIVERLKNGERLTIETKVKTDAGSAENISIYASRRPDGRFSIVTGRGNGADNLTAAQLKKKLDRMKFENPEESSARFEPAEKREDAVPAKKNAVSERVLYHWDHNGEWNNKGKSFSELMEGFVAMMDAGKELLVDTARGRYKFHKKAGEYEGVFPSGKVQRYSYDELYGKFAGWIAGGKPNNRFLVEEPAASAKPGKSAAEKESTPKSRSGVIEDFGEKIEGARKDYAQKLSDASRNDPAAVPLSQAFPEPDYDRLAESGIPARAVAVIHALRDSIGAKPRNGWRLAQYTKQLQTIREIARQIVNRELDSKQLDKVLANPLFNRIRESAELYEKLGHSKSLKGYRLSLGNYSVFGGVEYKPPKLIWTVSDSTGGRYRDVAFGDTREEAVANFKKYLDRETGEDRTRIKFDIFQYRPGAGAGKAGKVFIGKKVGSNTIELKRFDTAAEAREYLGSHQQELEELLKLKQYVPATRSDVNRGRIGQDYRGGKDVTPEMFQEKFDFRGVQFGNWVGKTEERQQNLNEAYDALHDLAGLLNVSTQALSLNGELGLAFGARGKGGVDPASAHYEPDHVVINLTRRNGAGSLAHEWFHALDNYFSRKGGVPTGYLSSGKRGDFAGVRPEMVQAFRKVIAELHDKTGIFDRSERLDEVRSKPYWSTDVEVAARAFESYLHDRIEAAGGSSDYLVNLVGESAFTTDMLKAIGGKTDLQDVYPYPTQKESTAVRKIFDEFVGTLREKSENGRAVLYSLSRKPESIQDFREMPAHPRPERAKFGSLRELYGIYKREYLGKTFTAASGHTITFKPGHFFRLIAGTPAGGRKGMVAKARNASEAIRMIERGEIGFKDIAGYEDTRAGNINLFKDVLTDADFFYPDGDKITFGKKYEGLKQADGFLAVTLKIDRNGNIGPVSFHPRRFTDKLLDRKEIKWNIAGIPAPANAAGGTAAGKQSTVVNSTANSAAVKSATGETAEAQSGGITSNIVDRSDKSSPKSEFSLNRKPRQQVNPIVSNEDIRREYAEELGRNTYTPETVAEWDRKAVDWITRQGGVAGAVEAILHDTEHNDRHVASLVRRHVMNSDVFAKLDEDSRAKLETHHAFTGTEWGREGVARRLAALTLDSVAKVRALFDKLHADLPDKEKTELRNKVLDETGVDIFKLPKDIAENRRKLDAVLRSELAARSSRGDQLYEFWINSILSGPATHVRNIAGNTLNTAYELGPKRAVEAAINVAVRNPKGATFGEMREMWKHLDWKTAWDRAVEAFDLEVLNPSGKYNDHAGVAIGGKKGRIIRIPGRLLRAADEFCKGLIAPVEAAAYAYREGRAQKLSGQELADFINARINDGTSRASQWGELRARELAFQEEPGAAVRWLVSLKNSNTPAGWIARIVFPFVQAPGNLLRQGVRKSPLGAASLLAVDLPRAIRSREVTPEMMAHAAEQLIAWSTLIALWSAQDDDDDERPLLTGSGAPYGSNERNFKANKFPPLSVRIGDQYYTYKFFEPLSSGLAVIANGLEAMRAKRPAEAKKALVGMSGFIAEKSYLASVKELFEFFQDPEHSGTRFATNFAASWVPNAYRQAVNAFDDKVRDNRTRARGLKYFTDQFDIVTNSAGFTRALPKLDYFGREVDKDAYADSPAGPLMRLLSVQSAAPDRTMDQADRLLWNYNRRNPESAYWPGLPSYYLKQGNRTLYIEGEDYAAFARDAGQLAHKAILSEIRSGSLNVKNPGETDIKRIKLLFTQARKTAKEKYKGKFHE